jgi:hypothetical protein
MTMPLRSLRVKLEKEKEQSRPQVWEPGSGESWPRTLKEVPLSMIPSGGCRASCFVLPNRHRDQSRRGGRIFPKRVAHQVWMGLADGAEVGPAVIGRHAVLDGSTAVARENQAGAR